MVTGSRLVGKPIMLASGALSALSASLARIARAALPYMICSAGLIAAAPAEAGCASPSPSPQCRTDFDQFSAVTWAGSAFVAVGHLRNAPQTAWALARVTPDGRVGPPVNVSWT